jgi:hypothetical protein
VKSLLATAAVVVALVAAGCGGSGSGGTVAPNPTTTQNHAPRPHPKNVFSIAEYGDDWDNYWWDVVGVKMPSGRVVVCVRVQADGDYPLSISCNWEGYNASKRR